MEHRLIAPFCWGVRRFKYHRDQPACGKAPRSRTRGGLPDGLVVVHGLHDAGRDGVLEIDLSKQADQIGERGMLVYVARRRHHNGNSNGDFAGTNHSKAIRLPIEISAAKARPIHRLKPRLTLHAGSEAAERLRRFPTRARGLSRLFLRARRQVHSSAARRPSQTQSTATPHPLLPIVWATCVQTSRNACGNEQCTSPTKREIPAGEAVLAMRQALELSMLSLVGALPRFEAVLQTGCAHPYQVYVALCGMAGQLSVLGTEMVPPSFDPYNHNDLYSTFQPVLDFIDRAMDQGVPVTYKSFPFKFHEGAYELRFDSAWMKKKLAIGIKGERGMSEDEVVRWGESCLIGSQNRIEVLRANRIRGADAKTCRASWRHRQRKRSCAVFVNGG